MLHGYNPPHRYLPYLSWTEIADLPDKENTVIVLPTGATEQHGPHLPCAVDTVISAGVVGHALARLPADVPAFAMAPITYGKSEEHLHFPGTVTLSGETLLATMNEVGESVYRAGFRKLLFVNGHGGQPQVMEMCARELRLRHGDFIVVPSFTWRVPHVAGKYLSDTEKKLAMHAGHAETALMLALAPDRVRMALAENFHSTRRDHARQFAILGDGRSSRFSWATQDLNPKGAAGNARAATAEAGQAIIDHVATRFAALLGEVARFSLDNLVDGPSG